ncbi:DUF1878 family protein [Pontibacillus salicampi]|uniref:DUF1878 family protein n=1 Tax=Pontibacillus salicampi TaxID=1449801 RepID=A0ABV6LM73_9BACI
MNVKGQNRQKCDFQIRLLSYMVDGEQYPFSKMLIEKEFTESEYIALVDLLETLEVKYKEQKEEGLLDFTSLLLHFAGMLNIKLNPDETIRALWQEGFHRELMEELDTIRKLQR